MDEQLLIFYLAGVPLLGILAQWLAWRLRVPSILLLLAFGILLGQFIELDGLLARLAESDAALGPKLLFPIVSLSVAVILFEGGLTLRFHELNEAGPGVLRLVTIGAVVSWVLTALTAWWLLGLHPQLATLLGAILVVTGPTVVAPILRQIRPERRIGSIIKWEGIVIDPIGAVLAVLVFEVVFAATGDHGVDHNGIGHAVIILFRTLLIGGLIGVSTAWLLVAVLRRYWLPDYLHGVAFLTVALAVFAISNWLQHESGLLTVTVLGILLANQKQISIRHVVEFKEHLGIFLISCLFIVLGSRLDLGALLDLGWGGFGFIAAMILLVRPLSVMLAMFGDRTTWSERVLLAFLAPRGIVAAAVTSVFALEVSTHLAGNGHAPDLIEQTERLVPITFLVIVCTVTIYGLLAGPLARWLGLADPNPQGVLFAGADPWVRSLAKLIQEADFQVLLVDTNHAHVAEARMMGLPTHCASILSEFAEEEMNIGGIGRMLAVTPNDEVNALAVREMAHVFGRRNVYQMASESSGSRRRSVGEHLRGRVLFQDGLSAGKFAQMVVQNFVIKKTTLTDTFSYEDFERMYGDDAVVLFVISEKKKLQVCSLDETIKPGSGDTLLSLVPAVVSAMSRKQKNGTTPQAT